MKKVSFIALSFCIALCIAACSENEEMISDSATDYPAAIMVEDAEKDGGLLYLQIIRMSHLRKYQKVFTVLR